MENEMTELAEWLERVNRLMKAPRGLTHHAAVIVVDAAMFGIGCTEGTVRAQIEKEKLTKTPASV